MTEQWQELKETIIELRDNDGTGTQQEICKFLANYMDVLEEQMSEPKTIQEKQAESEKYQKAFDDGYDNGYAQARFDYEQNPKTEKVIKMRRPTPEERESIEKYVKSISKPTGVNFWDLEHEPCEDAISREKAKQFLYERLDRLNDDELYDIFSRIIDDMYNELPSVKPQEPKWIPVSEGLPKEAYGCLVTVLDTNVITQEEFENILPYFVGYDGETWNDADGNICPFEVIAWMPLPKPYEP